MSTGGKLSLGPPLGGMILAQDARNRILRIEKIMMMIREYFFKLCSLKNQT
jgi:hypothetical protein